MNRLFRVLASCLFAAVIAFGSLVGGAFAATTPNPANFQLFPTQSGMVQLNPQIQSFTVLYSTPGFQGTTVSVTGGTCNAQSITIPRGSVGYSNTYSCGSTSLVRFINAGNGDVDVSVSQVVD
jgi:hypothetical protein